MAAAEMTSAQTVEQLATNTAHDLHQAITRLPEAETLLVQQAHRRATQAAHAAAAALTTDPTLTDDWRDLDLLAEIVRQLAPLTPQAENELRRRALIEQSTSTQEITALGSTNPDAPQWLDAMSNRAVEVAQRIAAAARPDWNTAGRIRERSARLLPTQRLLEEIADRLRHAVAPALALSHPTPQALRLANLADQITAMPEAGASVDAPRPDGRGEPQ
jgi:hypothetical protein